MIPHFPNMGPHHRFERRSPQHDPRKNIHLDQTRTRSAREIDLGTPKKGIHQTIKEPIRRPLLLHKKERQETATSARLPETQPMDHPQPIPHTSHFRTDKLSKRGIIIL